MADAPYTPSLDELRQAYDQGRPDYYNEFDRAIAAHVADEVERLADEYRDLAEDSGEEVMPPRTGHRWMTVEVWLRARAAELRKEQTDE